MAASARRGQALIELLVCIFLLLGFCALAVSLGSSVSQAQKNHRFKDGHGRGRSPLR